jgi:glycosyltransferase involved in cell wall biosynthesis
MIYAVLPTGSFHGWGVCGKYITKELSRIAPVALITEGFDQAAIQDVFDHRLLKELLVPEHEQQELRSGAAVTVDVPVLQNIVDKSLRPALPAFRGAWNVGYTFFEDNVLHPSFIENGRRLYDVVVTGSYWCEEVLRGYGLTNVTTIIQGIDPTIFNPGHAEKEYLQDKFVIFSGGKFELRKGQDLVVRAFKVMQDRYRDVMLVNSWYNHWAASMQTMTASPHIRFDPRSGDYMALMEKMFADNGIDPARVITLPPLPNVMMTRIYRNSDIGVFPNRCEGGTNLVLMEYMACGKPAIASYSSGHRDVLTDRNSLPLRALRPISISHSGEEVAVWDDPQLHELIERLDWAYHHRDQLRAIGGEAGGFMAPLTWGRTARQFHDVLNRQNVSRGVPSHQYA